MQPHEIHVGDYYSGGEGYSVRRVEEVTFHHPARVAYRRVRDAKGKVANGPKKVVSLTAFCRWAEENMEDCGC